MKKKIVIRVDGGSSIGMGHVVRCLAIGEMLKHEYNITFAIQKPAETVLSTILPLTKNIIQLPETNDYEQDISNFITHLTSNEIVILDGYNFGTEYQKKIKNKGCKLVWIDDLHAWHSVADIIINHAEGVSAAMYSAEKYTKFCLGFDYVLLRSIFLNPTQKSKKITSIQKVFISMGAADVDNNTLKFTKALILLPGITSIHLMLSSVNSHLESIHSIIKTNPKQNIHTHFNISATEVKELLMNCDLAICTASGISIECCATGIPMISGYSAENQRGNLAGMEKHKTLVNFGSLNELSVSSISKKVAEIIDNPATFEELVKNQKKMIDGKSPRRISKIFNELINN